jgi:hypothetical protein
MGAPADVIFHETIVAHEYTGDERMVSVGGEMCKNDDAGWSNQWSSFKLEGTGKGVSVSELVHLMRD